MGVLCEYLIRLFQPFVIAIRQLSLWQAWLLGSLLVLEWRQVLLLLAVARVQQVEPQVLVLALVLLEQQLARV